eukprot:512024-Amorphochlora_amoeboformis.AAC.1
MKLLSYARLPLICHLFVCPYASHMNSCRMHICLSYETPLLYAHGSPIANRYTFRVSPGLSYSSDMQLSLFTRNQNFLDSSPLNGVPCCTGAFTGGSEAIGFPGLSATTVVP